jgi:hypothetical protein
MLARSQIETSSEKKLSAAPRERLLSEINALTTSELCKLQGFAQIRLYSLGHRAAGRESTDLLHEAILSTLDGRRRWFPEKVPFFHYLVGAMRSISYAWAEKEKTAARTLPAEDMETDEDGDKTLVPFHNIPAREPSPERALIARETVRTIMDLCHGDHRSQEILTALMDGSTSEETITAMGITQQEYQAAKKRIQRRLQKYFGLQSESVTRRRTASEVP